MLPFNVISADSDEGVDVVVVGVVLLLVLAVDDGSGGCSGSDGGDVVVDGVDKAEKESVEAPEPLFCLGGYSTLHKISSCMQIVKIL